MSQTAQKKEFVPREGLTRTLQYRPQIKWIRMYLNLITLAVLSNTFLFSSLLYLKGQFSQSGTAFIGGLAIAIATFLFARSKIAPLTSIKYHLHSSGISIEQNGTREELAYADVTRIQFSFLSQLFGWFTMTMKNHKKYNFSFLIERSDYILESAANCNSALVTPEKFAKYRKLLLNSDHALARLYGGSLKATLAKYLGYPVVFAIFYWFSGESSEILSMNYLFFQCAKMFLITFFINLLIGKVVFLSSEAFVQYRNEGRLKLNPNLRTRDLEFEAKIRTYAYVGHFVLFLAFCVFFMVSIH